MVVPAVSSWLVYQLFPMFTHQDDQLTGTSFLQAVGTMITYLFIPYFTYLVLNKPGASGPRDFVKEKRKYACRDWLGIRAFKKMPPPRRKYLIRRSVLTYHIAKSDFIRTTSEAFPLLLVQVEFRSSLFRSLKRQPSLPIPISPKIDKCIG